MNQRVEFPPVRVENSSSDVLSQALVTLFTGKSELVTLAEHNRNPSINTAHSLLVKRLIEIVRDKQLLEEESTISDEELLIAAQEYIEPLKKLINHGVSSWTIAHYSIEEHTPSARELVALGLITHQQLSLLQEYLLEGLPFMDADTYGHYLSSTEIWLAEQNGDVSFLTDKEKSAFNWNAFKRLTSGEKPTTAQLTQAEEIFRVEGKPLGMLRTLIESWERHKTTGKVLSLIDEYLLDVDAAHPKNPFRRNSKKHQQFEDERELEKSKNKREVLEYIARLGNPERLMALVQQTFAAELEAYVKELVVPPEHVVLLLIHLAQKGKGLSRETYYANNNFVKEALLFHSPPPKDREEAYWQSEHANRMKALQAHDLIVGLRLRFFSHGNIPAEVLRTWELKYNFPTKYSWD